MYLSTFLLFDNSPRWKNIGLFFLFENKCIPLSLFVFFFSLSALLARVHMNFACSRGGNWLIWKKYSAFLFSLFFSLSLSFRCKRVKSREGFKVQEDNLNVFSGRLALIKNAAREKVREKIHSAKIPRMS